MSFSDKEIRRQMRLGEDSHWEFKGIAFAGNEPKRPRHADLVSVIFPEATGHLPGLSGRLNPIRDTHDRTYLYASNIAINEGQQQPVTFVPGEDLRLTDADGRELIVRIVTIIGKPALIEYHPYSTGDSFGDL